MCRRGSPRCASPGAAPPRDQVGEARVELEVHGEVEARAAEAEQEPRGGAQKAMEARARHDDDFVHAREAFEHGLLLAVVVWGAAIAGALATKGSCWYVRDRFSPNAYCDGGAWNPYGP